VHGGPAALLPPLLLRVLFVTIFGLLQSKFRPRGQVACCCPVSALWCCLLTWHAVLPLPLQSGGSVLPRKRHGS
jgi:hypothetical protein